MGKNAPKPCDWCKKRRQASLVEVSMSSDVFTLFRQPWILCLDCTKLCRGQLETVFQGRRGVEVRGVGV